MQIIEKYSPTDVCIGRAGNCGLGFDSLSKNLTNAADKDASCSWKIQLFIHYLCALYRIYSKLQ